MRSNATSVLCDACAQLGTMAQSAAPHTALLDRGSHQSSDDSSVDQMFRCANCNTIWVRHVDKWGIAGTFRLVSNTAPVKSS